MCLNEKKCTFFEKKWRKLLLVRIFVLFLHRLNQSNTTTMKTVKVELTEKENDLIQAIRNYRKSYIFASPEMIFYIEKLFTELMDGEE